MLLIVWLLEFYFINSPFRFLTTFFILECYLYLLLLFEVVGMLDIISESHILYFLKACSEKIRTN